MAPVIIIQLLTGFIIALFAGLFLTFYFRKDGDGYLLWAGLAYAVGLGTYLFEIACGDSPSAIALLVRGLLFWSYAFLLLRCACGIAGRRVPVGAAAALVALGVAALNPVARPHLTHVVATSVELGIAAVLVGLAALILCGRGARGTQWLLAGALGLNALTYALLPVLVFGLLGETQPVTPTRESALVMSTGLAAAIFAPLVGVAICAHASLSMIRHYHVQARRDALTDLPNRRGLEFAFDRGRGGGARFLILFDLDRFKEVNDAHGHGVGDAVLVRVARTAGIAVGGFGMVARTGGEEFAGLVSVPDERAARMLAEHMRLALALAVHPELPHGQSVTGSFGIAAVAADDTLGSACDRADRALYAAKAKGRNRVEAGWAQPAEEQDEPQRERPQLKIVSSRMG